MPLLDSNIANYVLKLPESFFSETVTIEDESGNKLGKLKGSFFAFSKYSLLDDNDSLVLTFKKKTAWKRIHDYYEIKNASGEFIGKLSREGGFHGRNVFLEDANGKEVFRSEIPSGENPEGIYDENGDVIAEVSRKRKLHHKLFGGTGPWNLNVLNQSTNRILLLGLFVLMFLIRPQEGVLTPG